MEMNKALIREHAVTGIEQAAFDQKAAAYDERFRKADAKLNRLKAEKQDRLMRACGVKKYVENLRRLAERGEGECGEAERGETGRRETGCGEGERGEAERGETGCRETGCGEGRHGEAESGKPKRGQAGPIEVWNEQAWCLLVTQVTVHVDGSAEFIFRGENSITVK